MISLFTNPYTLPAILIGLAMSHGAVGWKAYRMGQDNVTARVAELVSVEVRTRDAALAAAGEAISKIEVRNVTYRQKAETITREVPVYRDCRHDGDGLRLVNQALTDADEPVGGGKLPAADAAVRR